MEYVRNCPNGHERPATELVCSICEFPFSLHDIYPISVAPDRPPGPDEPEPDPYRPDSPRDPLPPETPARMCPNGHPVDEDDAICLTCGETVAQSAPDPDPEIRTIGEWQILATLPGSPDEAELFLARAEHGTEHRAAEILPARRRARSENLPRACPA